VGALKEFIREGENGFIYPPGDIKSLSAIMQKLASSPGLVKNMTDGLGEWITDHPVETIEENAEAFANAYRKARKMEKDSLLSKTIDLEPLAAMTLKSRKSTSGMSSQVELVDSDARRFRMRFRQLPLELLKARLGRFDRIVVPHLVPDEALTATAMRIRKILPKSTLIAITSRPDGVHPVLFDNMITYNGDGGFGWSALESSVQSELRKNGATAFVIPLNIATMPKFNGYGRTVDVGRRIRDVGIFGFFPDGKAGVYEDAPISEALGGALTRFIDSVLAIPYLLAAAIVWILDKAGAVATTNGEQE
jgi:hypothetical protein